MKRRIAQTYLLGGALLAALLAPSLALADAPDTRGPQTMPQGDVSGAPAGTTAWQGVRMLPPAAPAPAPFAAPMRQQGASGPLAWLDRALNPGNWILDAGMGIFAGIVKMFSGIAQKAVQALLGESIAPAIASQTALPRIQREADETVHYVCDNTNTNFIFCTPPGLTYDHPHILAIWSILKKIATSLLAILFVVRLGRMIVEGPQSLAAEGKGLLLTFILATAFVQATHPICKLLIDFFNGMSNLLLARGALPFPVLEVTDLSFGPTVLGLVFWVMLLILTLKRLWSLVQIIVLVAIAPLAGALMLDRATSQRFRAWFEKLIELLFTQINLAIAFTTIAAILSPYHQQTTSDQFVSFLLSIVLIGLALKGESLIGIAGGATQGDSLVRFVSRQVVGRALRRGLSQRRGDHRSPATTSGAGAPPDRSGATTNGNPAAPVSGNPSESAAARRQSEHPRPIGSFRAQESSGLSADRYQASVASSRQQGGKRPIEERRQLAARRETLMLERARATRREARELRSHGNIAQAEALEAHAHGLEQRAERQGRFALHGEKVYKPGRSSNLKPDKTFERNTMGQLRKQEYRQALVEVAGLHAVERETLARQIELDETRMRALQRDLGLRGASGAPIAGLHAEHQERDEQTTADRARLQKLTPPEGALYAKATYEAAAALANKRLPVELRGAQYAMASVPPDASPFIQRITGSPSQRSRDELARTQATAAGVANTQPGARPRRPRARPPQARARRAAPARLRRPSRSPAVQDGEEGDGI